MRHVIIGAGAAAMAAVKRIRALQKDAQITVISKDRDIHSRCMLHKYLSHERDEKALNFMPEHYMEDNGIRWVKGVSADEINTEERWVRAGRERYPYDRLLIATGADSCIPPVGEFRTAANVFGLRNLTDAQAIDRIAEETSKVIVVGSGLVGLDAAYGLAEGGKKVTVVEMAERILPIQLDEKAAYEYQKLFEKSGVEFRLGRKAERTVTDEKNRIVRLVLDDGEELECDLVIAATGVRPALGCLEGSSIACDRCIQVDSHMQTNCAGIFAAGDVTGLSAIWPNAQRQGDVAGSNMCGVEAEYEDRFALKNTINFFGLLSLCVGDTEPRDGDEIYSMEDRFCYKRAIVRGGRLAGMLLQGDISHAGIWQYVIKNKIDVSRFREHIFKVSFADFYGIGENGEYLWSV